MKFVAYSSYIKIKPLSDQTVTIVERFVAFMEDTCYFAVFCCSVGGPLPGSAA